MEQTLLISLFLHLPVDSWIWQLVCFWMLCKGMCLLWMNVACLYVVHRGLRYLKTQTGCRYLGSDITRDVPWRFIPPKQFWSLAFWVMRTIEDFPDGKFMCVEYITATVKLWPMHYDAGFLNTCTSEDVQEMLRVNTRDVGDMLALLHWDNPSPVLILIQKALPSLEAQKQVAMVSEGFAQIWSSITTEGRQVATHLVPSDCDLFSTFVLTCGMHQVREVCAGLTKEQVEFLCKLELAKNCLPDESCHLLTKLAGANPTVAAGIVRSGAARLLEY
jgi:hypothetical protein